MQLTDYIVILRVWALPNKKAYWNLLTPPEINLALIASLWLFESLRLQGVDYQRLNNHILRIVRLMKSLNIKAVLQTDTDFLGLFYEAFLRYGYDIYFKSWM